MKKRIYAVFLSSLLIYIAACPNDTPSDGSSSNNNNSGNNGDSSALKTGKVTFFNESSYSVIVHQAAFSGPVLLELSPGRSKQVDVRASDNYGVGSTFPIEYRYRVVDGTDLASGDVWTNGIDPNVQLNIVIEENKSYTLQIPQPRNLEFPRAFVKILNVSAMQFELRYKGTAFKQAGNGNLPVPMGKTGVYEFSSTAEGKAVSGYTVHSSFEVTAVPDFTAKNSYIYNFTYNGTTVVKTGEQKIVF
jgi:hypothetical protein